MHKHRCENCLTIWEHPNACLNDELAHTCPKCGEVLQTFGWAHYRGKGRATFSGFCQAVASKIVKSKGGKNGKGKRKKGTDPRVPAPALRTLPPWEVFAGLWEPGGSGEELL